MFGFKKKTKEEFDIKDINSDLATNNVKLFRDAQHKEREEFIESVFRGILIESSRGRMHYKTDVVPISFLTKDNINDFINSLIAKGFQVEENLKKDWDLTSTYFTITWKDPIEV